MLMGMTVVCFLPLRLQPEFTQFELGILFSLTGVAFTMSIPICGVTIQFLGIFITLFLNTVLQGTSSLLYAATVETKSEEDLFLFCSIACFIQGITMAFSTMISYEILSQSDYTHYWVYSCIGHVSGLGLGPSIGTFILSQSDDDFQLMFSVMTIIQVSVGILSLAVLP